MCELVLSAISALATTVAAACAAIAAFQTHKQIKLSNKQSLFDKRVERWIKADSLLNLFKSNRHIAKVEDGPALAADFIFTCLTNTAWLEDAANGLGDPKKGIDKKTLLTRLEDVRALAKEISFLFEGEAGELLSAFVAAYADLLSSLYRYQLIVIHLHEDSEQFRHTLEEACESIGEDHYREYLARSIANTEAAYDAFILSKSENAIKSQIKVF